MIHTLGPLTIIKDPQIDGVDYAIMSEDTLLIGEAYGQTGSTTDSFTMPARANALLWATSPDLLDALVRAEQMIRILVLRGVFSGDEAEIAENEAADFRAIVMKAKGQPPKEKD